MDLHILLVLDNMTIKELVFPAHKWIRHTMKILYISIISKILFI